MRAVSVAELWWESATRGVSLAACMLGLIVFAQTFETTVRVTLGKEHFLLCLNTPYALVLPTWNPGFGRSFHEWDGPRAELPICAEEERARVQTRFAEAPKNCAHVLVDLEDESEIKKEGARIQGG